MKPSLIFMALIILCSTLVVPSFAQPQTEIKEIDKGIGLEKTVATMTIPDDEKIRWGYVKGIISDPVERYPVIIQFFKGDEPVHVAQVKVKGDSSFEYKFKVRAMDGDNLIDIFEGEYTVKIFKVVHMKDNFV